VIEGDNLDLAHPSPWQSGVPLAELNLAAMWQNYESFGFHRLIYTNTASVLPPVMSSLMAALGGAPVVTAVLLGASDVVTNERLAQRERGMALAEHIERSATAATVLEAGAPSSVYRVDTAGRTVSDVAADIIGLTGWLSEQSPSQGWMPHTTRSGC
jgi:hypothetical protein